MSEVTRFIWLRHFPVAESGIFVGQLDVEAVLPPLTKMLTQEIEIPQAVWFSSPLRRAVQTAEWIQQSLNSANEAIYIPELMEQSFGLWEGKKYSDIHIDSTQPDTLKPPQGESFFDVTQRVHGWIEQMVRKYKGRTLIVICHAGVIRAALGHALGADAVMALRFQPAPASVTEIQYIVHDGVHYGQVAKVGVPLIMHAEQGWQR